MNQAQRDSFVMIGNRSRKGLTNSQSLTRSELPAGRPFGI